MITCDALLFDMDGVLVDSRAIIERTWRRWARLRSVDPEPFMRVAHGRPTSDTLREVMPRLDVAREAEWLDEAESSDFDGLIAMPGAARLLASLGPDDWAIVTSAGRDLARRRLESAGLPLPRILVTSEVVARGKPSPDGYRAAARMLSRIPSACVVFEDAPAGVAAGRAAGARVIALTTTHPATALTDADDRVTDLGDVSVRHDAGVLVVELREHTAGFPAARV